ncbi:Membrane-bound lytic murein transglycosylase B [Dickeya dianthicola]|uniref:Lytic murein transglycosylase n=1 Tax=Dickeya dianthicola TaxID=204039 RepID=A0AAP2GEJ3_9GAMM|nr:lytic murein transglycosylase [Dickeya dianthicola]ATO33348.1 Membrane-bound lytic murein transglycosylase precursor [Dickeya dianthicola RNS04.9]AYC19253.1 Membrane-bound lytic murein transglycosylase B [Dickeya dianthicola]MBI0438841.1 lytic murein transglycosylase [Dickeya dianthicola]MBI0450411.1 lytic murein transglycosylase [Dickeya dianthicola]MBI0455466.1 lytic murein transglycosylase [Dickeya dianthicola]
MINNKTQTSSVMSMAKVMVVLLGAGMLSSCAHTHAPPGECRDIDGLLQSHGVTDTSAGLPTPDESVDQWKAALRQEALSQGITAGTFDNAFAGLTLDSDVVAATQKQPELVTPVWTYIEQRVTPDNIAQGKTLLKQYAKVTARIEQRYPVEPSLLFAFLAIESHYGANTGDKAVIRSLATLDYYNYRRAFNRQNLIAALRMIQNGDAQPQQIKGSWAGAMGMPQFIPTSYLQYAVDFDGDRRPDIWTLFPDTLASVANYMQQAKWKAGVPWGFEVRLPAGFDYSLSGLDNQKTVADWQARGVKAAAPRDLASLSSENASILLPVGKNGPAFLVTGNYRAILRYNNYQSYALTVGLLSDNYRHDTPVLKPWPRQQTPLTRKEREALQILLQEKQLYQGAIDGNMGRGTTQAIRTYQQQQGLPADGYPDHALLDRLRCG